MAIDYNIMGERIKKARLEKQLTQENIAEKLDVSVAFLSRIERGSSHINLKRLQQLCSILDVSEGYLLSGTSEDSKNYLNKDFQELLEKCNPEQLKLLSKVLNISIDELLNNKVLEEHDEPVREKKLPDISIDEYMKNFDAKKIEDNNEFFGSNDVFPSIPM